MNERLQRLFDALAAEPWAHDFFATLRRVEALAAASPRLGRALRPGAEPIRLGQDAELDFAPAALSSFEAGAHAPPRLGVRFFGLFGPMGPMPLHLTEYVRDRQRNHADAAWARFADVFHHRALLLFYRAWAEAQPVVQADRPDEDRFAAWIAACFGASPAALRHCDGLPDAAKRYHSGNLSRATRQPEAMRKLLGDYFGVPVRIESHVGHWMQLRREDRTRLGSRLARRSAPLGISAVAGSRRWDRQYKLRVHLGPLTLAQYRSFLPGGTALPALRDWMRHLLGFEMLWDVQLELRADEVPRLQPDRHAALPLGRCTWLGRRPPGAAPAALRLDASRLTFPMQSSSKAPAPAKESPHG